MYSVDRRRCSMLQPVRADEKDAVKFDRVNAELNQAKVSR